jgi:hypothetical protein
LFLLPGLAGPVLKTLQLQGGPFSRVSIFYYHKTIKISLLFIKLFFLAGLSPPFVAFRIEQISTWA